MVQFQSSFIIDPAIVPARMSLLVTLFLVLINIFNSMKSDSPQAESGFTAVSAWLFSCIMFVFGALVGYTIMLFQMNDDSKVFEIWSKKT